MPSFSSSARIFHEKLIHLFDYGLLFQVVMLSFSLLEVFLLREMLSSAFASVTLCGIILATLSIALILHLRRGSPRKRRKKWRFLFLLLFLQSSLWGGSSLLFIHANELHLSIHTLLLLSISISFSFYLAPFPRIAYTSLGIIIAPFLALSFFTATHSFTTLVTGLFALVIMICFVLFFFSRIIEANILFKIQNQKTLRTLTTKLHQLSQEKLSKPTGRSEAIWNAILTITDQAHLQDTWQNCFSGKLSSLCHPLETSRIYIVEANYHKTPTTRHQDKYQASIDHSWIFNNSDCIALLKSGQIVDNRSPLLSEWERGELHALGIRSFLDIPILIKDSLWGLIGMDRMTTDAPFTESQIKGLKLIANILALTIRNQQDRAERNRLAAVVEQSNDCVLLTNPAGHILYANPACETITGYSPSEIINTNIAQLHPETIMDSEIWQQVARALHNGEKWQGQFPNYRKDLSLYEEEMLLSPAYDPVTNIINQVIVKRNITEKKRLESVAEAANLMDNIGFIFSSIRHELGNPINAIKVSLSVLDSNLHSYDHADIKRFINRSLADIGRVEYLLKTLKNFSIFERPIIEDTDMTALLTRFVDLVNTDLERKDIKLTTNITTIKDPRIGKVDHRAFQQVLLNLVTNAADALASVEPKRITITMLKEKNGQINIIIGDNGCGIGEEEQANLFKPFYTTKPQGTGLGLIIVKKMLAKMNCSIAIYSKKNKGTKVLIVIPGPEHR